ncbi:hypothetical protein JOE40_001001 [Arthrobacter sp. PvP102]|uniref:hypothetical protein n=1 Tax=unclassified Arthrobacter TaxID=235627 RepID=UPI0000526AF2|nr:MULTISPECIES: hypothetical protein [unclassified Arthrobacter]ABK03440.1 conserved hypothetical protein [Arthrobacter sp. FB24]MBP1231357.1 hypothetical protein [Arthrobacter sp. PvP103]MBP1236492.1 hypothetical protein [Arthrobacter sp. PvP102]
MSGEPEADPRWKRAVDMLAVIGPPLTIATALLVYFGWARTDAQAKAMGLDVSLFGFTVQDFVLRSIPSLFIPLVWLLIVASVWLSVDRFLAGRLNAGRRAGIRRLAAVILVAGLACATAMWIVVILQPERTVLFVPYIMAGGVLLSAWGLSLWRRSAEAPGRNVAALSRGSEKTLIFCLVTLLLFWGTSDYAQALGRGLAVSYEQRSALLPTAVVYSKDRLGISAPNVTEQSSGTAEHPVYQYSGLRLLVVSGGRVFLLNEGWTLRSGKVVVLRDDPGMRVEYGNPESK